ncbi:MAG TPA: GyrI-like domain-containing protein [Micromonosporaceae bacterium]|nr:GyrI-like domain-containing protein [Micromonosporaceae bacterium]
MPYDLPDQPEIVLRTTERYVGVARTITMDTFHELADRVSELFDWLGERGIAAAGAPFFRLNVIDMARELRCETGVPIVDAAAVGAAPVFIGVLPAGRYVRYTHVGHVDELVEVTAAVLDWADEQRLVWDKSATPDGDRWGCRLIVNLTDPDDEPDMSKWRTTLLFRLAD